MDTDFTRILTQLKLDRNGEVPLYRQLRAAIEMAIIDGELVDGLALPSVRRLATFLGVAPVTVVQAYRDLQDQQLIRAVPKRGYFVSVNPVADPLGVDLGRLQERIDDAIRLADESGLDDQQFMRMVFDRVKRRRIIRPTIAVVGKRNAALTERVATTQDALADFGANVIGLSFEDLANLDPSEYESTITSVEIFLVPVGEVQRAAALLPGKATRIQPMTRTIRDDVRAFIAQQPPTTKFGVIGDSEEFAERIIAVARRIHPFETPPVVAVATDTDAVQAVINDADALIIGSLALAHLIDVQPIRKPAIEFVSLPDRATLEKLRARLNEKSWID